MGVAERYNNNRLNEQKKKAQEEKAASVNGNADQADSSTRKYGSGRAGVAERYEINQFINDYDNYVNSYNSTMDNYSSKYNDEYYKNYKNAEDESKYALGVMLRNKELSIKADDLSKRLQDNKEIFGDNYQEISDTLSGTENNLKDNTAHAQQTPNYWKQFSDASDYNNYQNFSQYDYEEALKKVQELDAKINNTSTVNQYDNLSNQKDWLEKNITKAYDGQKDYEYTKKYLNQDAAGLESAQKNIDTAMSHGGADEETLKDLQEEKDWVERRSKYMTLKNTDLDDLKTQVDTSKNNLDSVLSGTDENNMTIQQKYDYWNSIEGPDGEHTKAAKNDLDNAFEEYNNLKNKYQKVYDFNHPEEVAQRKAEEQFIEDNASDSFLGAVASNFYSGVMQTATSFGSFVDSTLGELFRTVENSSVGQYLGMDLPGEQIHDLYENSKAYTDKQQMKNYANSLKYDNSVENFTLGVGQALGSVIIPGITSIMSGGMGIQNAVGNAVSMVNADTKVAGMISNYLQSAVKDPQYWASFTTMAGDTYQTALDEGANKDQAMAAALINGTIGSFVEIGSGVQTQVGKANTIMNWAKSAAEEGNEEVIQGMFENATKKTVYDQDRSMFSLSDQDAVVNPIRSAQEFGYGAAAGGVMSGAVSVFNGIRSDMAKNSYIRESGQSILDGNETESIVSMADNFSPDTEIYKAGQNIKSMLKNNEKVNPAEIGQLYMDIASQNQSQAISDTLSVLNHTDLSHKEIKQLMNTADKMITGQDISTEEVNQVKSNKDAVEIFNKYLGGTPENISQTAAYYNNAQTEYEGPNNISDTYPVSMKKNISTDQSIPEDSALEPQSDYYDYMSESAQTIENDLTGQNTKYNTSELSGNNVATDATLKKNGEKINVTRYESTGNNIKLVTNNGTIDVNDVKLSDGMNAINNYASAYSVKSANKMLASYKALSGGYVDTDPEAFSREWDTYYSYGHTNSFSYADAKSAAVGNIIPDTLCKMAYDSGVLDKKKSISEKQSKINTTVTENTTKSESLDMKSDTYSSKVTFDKNVDQKSFNRNEKQKAAGKIMSVVADATGVNVVFYDGTTKIGNQTIDADGAYVNGIVYVDINAGGNGEKAILRTAAHELTHFIQDASPALYAELKTAITDIYYKGNADTFSELVNRQMEGNPKLTLEKATDEVIANACEMMLKDGSAVETLAKEHYTVFEKVKAAIDDFIQKIKDTLNKAFTGVEAASPEAVKLSESLNGNIEQIQEIWNKALSNSKKINTDNKYDVKFSLDESFGNKLMTWYSSKTPEERRNDGGKFHIGNTSEALKSIGVSDYDIFIGKGKIQKILEKHNEMDISIFHKIPNLLENPIIIFESNSRPQDSIVILGEVYGNNDQAIMVALNIYPEDRKGNIHDFEIIASSYGRKNTQYQNSINNNKILYIDPDKSRTNKWLSALRLQLPSATTTYGSINKVTQPSEKINTKLSTDSDSDIELASRNPDSLTPRAVLSNALKNTAANSAESEMLTKYQKAIDSLNEKEQRLNETRKAIKEISFSNGTRDTESLEKLQKSAMNLERSINYWDGKLLNMESTQTLKNLVNREKASVMKKIQEESKVKLAENRAKNVAYHHKDMIMKDANAMIKWIENPSTKNYVPDALKQPVLEFLDSLDFISSKADPESFYTKQWADKMTSVSSALAAIKEHPENYGDYTAIIEEADPDLLDNMVEFQEAHKNDPKVKISSLKPEDMKKLYEITRSLKKAITNANKLHANKLSENLDKIGSMTVNELRAKKAKNKHSGLVNAPDKLLNIDMLDSFSYFNMLGEGGKSIYNEIRKGFNDRVFCIDDAQKYMAENLLKGKTDREKNRILSSWTGKKAEKHTFETRDGSIELTTGQLMSLYCLSKREQALGHILKGGIKDINQDRITVKDDLVQLAKKTANIAPFVHIDTTNSKQVETRPVHITEGILNTMLDELTPEQRATADMMQRYLSSTVADWGNEISMQLYGYRKFTEKYYWPIKTDSNSNITTEQSENQAALYGLKNMGATKNTVKKANNAIEIDDIFTDFTRHVTEMANYKAYVIPLQDAMKWYNYRNKVEIDDGTMYMDSVKEQIERSYGKDAKKYFINLIKELNGRSDSEKTLSDRLISRVKPALVSANIRVAIQQPTAYLRASAVMNPKYLAEAVTMKPAVKESQEYSGIAKWKSWGYFETGIGQSMEKVITGRNDSFKDAVSDKTMLLAQLADDITWGTIWNACKCEIKDTRKDLEYNSKEFMAAVADRYDDVIDQTQVVDTVLHRSQIMRSNNGFNKLETAFMAEPTKSYNMLRNAIVKQVENPSLNNAKKLSRTLAAYLITGLFTASMSTMSDASRNAGDEKDKDWLTRYLEAFKGNAVDNVNPLGMIPYVKEVLNFIDGFDANRMDLDGIKDIVTAVQTVDKYFNKPDYNKTPYYVSRKVAKALSDISGIPVYNAMREVESLYNTFAENPISYTYATYSDKYKKVAAKFADGDYSSGLEELDSLVEDKKQDILKDYPEYSGKKAEQEAESYFRTKTTSYFKPQYVYADKETRSEIQTAMYKTGLYDSMEDVKKKCSEWLASDLKNQYLAAESGGERTEIRKQLYATGKWKDLSDLDNAIKKWKE